jgi:ATP-binding cassette, subfamily B, bacterial MsbA
VALVIYVASLLSRQDALSPGEFVAFITAMSMIFEPIRRLTNVSATLQKGLAAAQSLFGMLDADGETHRPDDHEAPTSYTLSGDIDFQNLSFSYPGQDQDAVSGLTLKVREGESVVLVGPSGFGKSTLLYLLAGLDTPRSGRILIGGTDLCYIDRPILRANLSMVAQQTVLFDLSILENVRLARPTASNEDVLRALSDANALAFVKRLPRGVDTPLGFHGSRLSGGQRQRLALARAFLKDAPILLLDEPTSALDGENETEVLEAIQCLSRGRTTLIVSHDPEKLSWVNRVLDLSKPSSGSPVVQHD